MDKLDLDKLTEAVGGWYKLTCLIQKRMRELRRGHPPLVDGAEGKGLMQIVLEEIALGKVKLVFGEEAQRLRELREKGPPLVEEGEES